MTAALSASPSASPLPVAPLPGVPPKLSDYLRRVPDPRKARGKRHSLEAILLLVVVGTLAGRTHRLGIQEWGREADAEVQRALGFRHGRTPAASTLHKVLGALNWDQFAAELRQWTLALLAHLDPDGHAALSCDGKSVRGSLREGSEVAHLLSAFIHDLGITLDLEPVSRKSNEIPGTPKLLLRLPVAGRTVVVDALLTQEAIARALVEAGADYVMPVKGNQPGLQEALREIFTTRLPPDWTPATASSTDQGHGRREIRRLTLVQPPPGARLDWGRAHQYFLLERVRRTYVAGQEGPAVRTLVYGVTSLPRRKADAAQVLKLIRSHWQIENRSHWVRDTLFREDESRSAKPTIVQVLAGLRCAAVTLLHYRQRTSRYQSLASLQRLLEQRPAEILALTGTAT